MNNYSGSTYGEHIAEVYDLWYTEFDQSTISTLVELSKGGRALELGIGTGRIALPLHHAGIEVHGIDASEAMLAKLKDKPGGQNIQVKIGNFADVDVEGHFDLVFVVFNTFFALLTQEEQIRCFENVASRLSSNGVFVIEVFVPDMARFIDHQTVRIIESDDTGFRLEVTRVDMLKQQTNSKHVYVSEEGIRMFPVKIRYAWPSELDLMARLAGLSLQHRWGTWRKDSLSIESGKHISVYRHSK